MTPRPPRRRERPTAPRSSPRRRARGAGAAVTRGTRRAGENLYLSLVVRPRVPAASLAPIALAIGLAVADVLAARVGARAIVAVKWPNDVLAGGRKLAGVLVEGQLRGSEVSSLIVGVGLNVHATSFPPDSRHARPRSRSSASRRDRDRSALAAELILAIGAAVRASRRSASSFLAAIARARRALRARVDVAGVRGVAAGIDAEGRLLVRGEGGAVTAIVSGEADPVAPACNADARTTSSAPAVKEDTLVIHESTRASRANRRSPGCRAPSCALTGCNLRCSWCDTPQAFYGGTRMPRAEVLAQALAHGHAARRAHRRRAAAPARRSR